jgi:hypothetical protein
MNFTISLREDEAAKYGRNAAHWGSMRIKYEQASRQPWRSINPDPPAPF